MAKQAETSVEEALREELRRGDTVLAGTGPVLRHFLSCEDSALFTDEVIARVRGMLFDIADQLLFAVAQAEGTADRTAFLEEHIERLVHRLGLDDELLAHAHAMALEGRLTEDLAERCAIDPVLPPLVQELTASGDETIADLAMRFLAAQARFMQHQRRMELPLGELPGDLFHKALLALKAAQMTEQDNFRSARKSLRKTFDEALGRRGLVTRLATSLRKHDGAAMRVEMSGLALFATTLAVASDQDRDRTVIALRSASPVRTALAMRMAGLEANEIRAQLATIRPNLALPDMPDEISPELATDMLAQARPVEAGEG
ncbi:hypothetical protein WYH_00613 [Croceibacterium atlanticum]|uniref:DUF2336 domain-containing protein n=1 Tax=Croceibacterium atlanticum TaxID=1267766 RepID=A0A0F7KQ40_9SPHN|nr:hypothetical protein WYH_00613 [Croceibacterium atlanticum]